MSATASARSAREAAHRQQSTREGPGETPGPSFLRLGFAREKLRGLAWSARPAFPSNAFRPRRAGFLPPTVITLMALAVASAGAREIQAAFLAQTICHLRNTSRIDRRPAAQKTQKALTKRERRCSDSLEKRAAHPG